VQNDSNKIKKIFDHDKVGYAKGHKLKLMQWQ
jgi:hypothetical protein